VAEPLRLNEQQVQKLQTFLDVFKSEKGQRVLEELRKDYCGSCFHENPVRMAFLEGQRQVVLDIEWTLKNFDKELIVEKENENQD
jgi:hypothetical protein